LIDWKQGDQSGAKKGLSISRITKKLTPGAWTHDSSKGVTELQRGMSLGNVGWRDNTSYIFRITFTSTLVEVFINDNLVMVHMDFIITVRGVFYILLSGLRQIQIHLQQRMPVLIRI